jgi:pentatricopeptide repeat protein
MFKTFCISSSRSRTRILPKLSIDRRNRIFRIDKKCFGDQSGAQSISKLCQKAESLSRNDSPWTLYHTLEAYRLSQLILSKNENSQKTIRSMVTLLKRWIDEGSESHDIHHLQGICNRVLNAMKSSDDIPFGDALDLLNKMEEVSDAAYLPDVKAVTMMLNKLASKLDHPNVLQISDDLFQRGLSRGGQDDLRLWNGYLHVISKCCENNKEAFEKADTIVKEMTDKRMVSSETIATYLHSMTNYLGPEKAQDYLFNVMQNNEIPVTEQMFNACLNGFAKQAKGLEAENLLRKMINSNIQPTSISFSCSINAWAKSDKPDSAERAQNLLLLMENLGIPLSANAYTPVIIAWSSSRKPGAAKKAMALLLEMERRYNQGIQAVCPSSISYNAAIRAFATMPELNAMEEAEELFHRMKEIARSGRKDFLVNTVSYSAFMEVLSRNKHPDAPNKAMNLLTEMKVLSKKDGNYVAPSVCNYNFVIAAFASRGDIKKTQELFVEMVEQANEGNSQISPDTHTYIYLFQAFAKSKGSDSFLQASGLLEKIETEFNSGKVKIKPSAIAITYVISSLLHSNITDPPQEALQILYRMNDEYKKGNLDMKPTSHTLCTVLRIIAMRHIAKSAPDLITTVLEWAWDESKKGNNDLRPDVACYNWKLIALAKSGKSDAVFRVSDTLKLMSTSEFNELNPNSESYIQLIAALQRSKEENAPYNMLRVLRFIVSESKRGNTNLKLSSRAINIILEDCSSCQPSARNLQALRPLLEELGSFLIDSEAEIGNSLTFELFFQACRHLAFGNQDLIQNMCTLSKRLKAWDSRVENSYKSIYSVT